MTSNLGHPAGIWGFAAAAWFAASMALVVGAIGSGLESDEEVRETINRYRPRPTDKSRIDQQSQALAPARKRPTARRMNRVSTILCAGDRHWSEAGAIERVRSQLQLTRRDWSAGDRLGKSVLVAPRRLAYGAFMDLELSSVKRAGSGSVWR